MVMRFGKVLLLSTALVLAGSPFPGTAAPPQVSSAVQISARAPSSVVAKAKKPKAPLRATFVLDSKRKVVLTLVTPSKKATIKYVTGKNKKHTKNVKIKNGTRLVTLQAGSRKIRVRAKATRKLRASPWVTATLWVPPVVPPVVVPTPTVDRLAAIEALLASAAPPRLTPTPISVTKSDLPNQGNYSLKQTCYDGVSNPSQLPVVTPNVSSLWPGALVRGDSVASGTLDEVPISDRLPMGIGIDNVLAGRRASVVVDHPSFTSMHDAINQVAPAAFSASKQYTVEVEAVSTFESLKAKLGVNASGMQWDAGFKLSTDWSSEAQHVFVKLSQAYFSVGVNNPQGAKGVFGPSVTAAALAPYVDADSPIGYIDSITYGREFVLVYTTKSTSFDLFAAVHGAYKGDFAKVTADSTMDWSKKMSQTSVKAFGIGGNAQQGLITALEASAVNMDALKAFVTQGATFSEDSQAAPLGYTVKSLVDNRLITLNNMDKYCVIERTVIEVPTCATDIQIWNSSSNSVVVPAGYTRLAYDLNMGVGGNFIYLMYKLSPSTDGCILDVAFANKTPCVAGADQWQPGWTAICSDLNAGAGGDFIWPLYSKATCTQTDINGRCWPITAFQAQPSATPPVGYDSTGWIPELFTGGTPPAAAELNRGAGGDNIFLSVLRAKE
jgi:hypothetical protein